MKKNAGLIAVLVVLLGGAGWFFYQNSRGPQIAASSQSYVCVSTGKVFQIPNDGRMLFLPLENPQTHEKSLLPCEKHEDGIYIQSQARRMLKDLASLNKAVDEKTGKVKSESK